MGKVPLLRSWFMAGFEGSSMTFPATGGRPARRVDAAAASGHLARAAQDYALVAAHGLSSVRDALDWGRIEPEPGRYDWSSFTARLQAAREAGVQVVWDLCHFGLPPHADVWSEAFPERFAAYAEAAAHVLAAEGEAAPVWSPINEISYWSWAAGRGRFEPLAEGRAPELKRRLVRAAVLAMERQRVVDARARFLLCDPIVHTVAPEGATDASEAERLSMFEVWDMVSGRRDPELGGRPELLDLVGVNYYPLNQWLFEPDAAAARTPLVPGDPRHRPPHEMLMEVWRRYRRPIVLSETGAEGEAGPDWLRYMAREVEEAELLGARVEGLCLFPAMDYPSWTDDRRCPCGLIRVADDWSERSVDPGMAATLADLQHIRSGPRDLARPNWLRRLGPAQG